MQCPRATFVTTETGEPRSHGNDPAKQQRVTVEIPFLLAGLVFVAFGVAIVLTEARARRGAWAVPGEVIGFSTGKGGGPGGPSYYPVAEYVGIDGRKRYLEARSGHDLFHRRRSGRGVSWRVQD